MPEHCLCPKESCPNHSNCRACVIKHRAKNEVPSCFFGSVTERIIDKSYKNFARYHGYYHK